MVESINRSISFPEIKDILLSLSREQIDHLLIEVIYARQENDSINNLRNSIKEEMRKNQNLRNEIARMEIVNQELSNNQPLISELKTEVNRVTSLLNFQYQLEAQAKRITDNLRADLAKEQELSRKLLEDKKQLLADHEIAVDELGEKQNIINRLADEKDLLQKEINRLVNLVTEHERLFHEQSNRLIDKDDQIFKISETNHYLERENKRYRDVTEQLQKDLTIAKTTITELKTQIERLENHLEDAEQTLEQDNYTTFTKQILLYDSCIAKMNEQFNTINAPQPSKELYESMQMPKDWFQFADTPIGHILFRLTWLLNRYRAGIKQHDTDLIELKKLESIEGELSRLTAENTKLKNSTYSSHAVENLKQINETLKQRIAKLSHENQRQQYLLKTYLDRLVAEGKK